MNTNHSLHSNFGASQSIDSNFISILNTNFHKKSKFLYKLSNLNFQLNQKAQSIKYKVVRQSLIHNL